MFRSSAIVLRRWKLFPTFLLILVTILLLAQMVPFETDKTSTDSCLGPVIKIGFAKTHKTASGTVQNVLLRHGWSQHAEFLFGSPIMKSYLKSGIKHFTVEGFEDSILPRRRHTEIMKRRKYDISALHVRWNRTAIQHFLGSEAKFVTILREPVAQFESMFGYYLLGDNGKPADAVMPSRRQFGDNVGDFVDGLQGKDPSKDIIQWDLLWYSFGANQQLFDLGVDREDALSHARLEESITKVDNDFELVMITELMYESLVLLADLLCIPLENVAVLKNINERPKDRVKQLTQKQEGTLRKFLQPDQMLYEHFKERLQKQIREYGRERMSADAVKLRQICHDFASKCMVHDRESSNIDIASFISESTSVCDLAAMGEKELIETLRFQVK